VKVESRTFKRFWKYYDQLPEEIRRQADKQYTLYSTIEPRVNYQLSLAPTHQGGAAQPNAMTILPLAPFGGAERVPIFCWAPGVSSRFLCTAKDR
jgi:hypothetical protein